VVVALLAVLVLLGLGSFVGPDSWLALVAGRIVAHDGPPSTDTLTTWTLGVDWVDQQWLGQLLLYAIWRTGGLTLVGLLHAITVIGTFSLILRGARHRGGSPGHTALIGLMALTPYLLVAGNIRTQSLALPLFAAVLWLLCADSRAPTARVLWTLPLLVLWANIHGSVVLGAFLTGMAGAVQLMRPGGGAARRPTALALVVLPGLTLMVTPYGSAFFTYLRDLLGNAEIARIASDWQPVVLETVNVPFFALATVALLLLGRDRSSLTVFEQAVLAVTLVGALSAARNLAWFALAAALLLPALVTQARGARARSWIPRRFAEPLAVVTISGAVVASVVGLTNMTDQVDRRFPPGAANLVARLADDDAALLIFAHPRYADWLLFREPNLAGRIPFDIRFELLAEAQLRRFTIFRDQIGAEWERALGGARLVITDSRDRPLDALPSTSTVLQREPGARLLFVAGGTAVVLRARSPATP